MADTFNIATAYVEFTTRGIATVLSGIDAMQQKVASFSTATIAAGVAVGNIFADAMRRFASAGLAGTAQASALHFWMTQLSRSIAGVFLPVIETGISLVARLTGFFRSLTEAQQNALQGLVVGLTAARIAMTALGGPLGLVVGLIAALATGSRSGQGALSLLTDAFSRALESIKPLLTELSNIFASVAETVDRVIDRTRAIFEELGASTIKTVSAIRDIIEAMVPDIESAAVAIIEAFKPVAYFLMNTLLNAFKAILAVVAAVKVVFREGLAAVLDPGRFVAQVSAEMDRMMSAAEARRQAREQRPDRPGRALGPGPGHFEDIAEQFRRIQEAASGIGAAAADPALTAAKETAANTKAIADNTAKPGMSSSPPGVGTPTNPGSGPLGQFGPNLAPVTPSPHPHPRLPYGIFPGGGRA